MAQQTTKSTAGARKTASGTAAAKSAATGAAAKKEVACVSATRKSSVWVFALALFFGVVAYLPGQDVWPKVRNIFFGVFGWSMYFLAPLLAYVAVLIAAGRPWRSHLTEIVLLWLVFSALTMLWFDGQYTQPTFWEAIKEMYQLGSQHRADCLLAVPLGLTLLHWTGRSVAITLLTLLTVVLVMLLTDVTPADILRFLRTRTSAVRQRACAEQHSAASRKNCRRPKNQRAEAKAAGGQSTDKEGQDWRNSSRSRWNIDVSLPTSTHVESALREQPLEVVPLETVKGEAFAPQDHPELKDMLSHDLLAQAGRTALRTSEAPAATLSIVERERVLYDQDDPPVAASFDAAPQPAATQPAAGENSPTGENSPAGEYEDLIRRALDGRAPQGEDGISEETLSEPQREAGTELLSTAEAAEQQTAAPARRVLPPYRLPEIELLDRQAAVSQLDADAELRQNAALLVNTLDSFGVKTKILDICRGPSVTRYELQPLAGVKISRITNLADDIALNLASGGVRIEAPIPGKPAVGIEVPNKVKATVSLRSILQTEEFLQSKAPLTMCLGKDIAGSVKLADLARMPHLLIAGSTGSGKSVCINSIIMSFLYKSTPDELRMILIDPKVVELAEYNGIPHLLMPVVTEPRKAAGALGSAVAEMERRYRLFAANNVRDIKSFNRLSEDSLDLEKLPYVAIVIDELADLMMVAGKQVEDYICRIAQKARAAGMHLIVATQRPSVDVITGLIKANIPSRIAFAVSSQVDSRTILDSAGAEKLLGMGDMLFLPVGAAKPTRIQGTFVKDSEIERVIAEIKSYADARYDEEMIADAERRATSADGAGKELAEEESDDAQDPMLREAIETVVEAKMASTSLLQRKLKLGYARAARIMDQMEALHIIGPYEGSKPRPVLITHDQFVEMVMRQDS